MTAPASAKRPSVGRRSLRPATDESPVFVDSNVFLYAIDEADPKKQQAARHWRPGMWRSRGGRGTLSQLGEVFAHSGRNTPPARLAGTSPARGPPSVTPAGSGD